MKKLTYKINIHASRQKVWDMMLQKDTYKEWSGAAWPGSDYDGEWKEGTDIRFIGPDGSGTLASLLEIKKYQYLFAKHIALLLPGGIEDRESKAAKGWIGMTESYTFTEKDGSTELLITMEAYPEWEEMLNDWNTGLQKLKEICER